MKAKVINPRKKRTRRKKRKSPTKSIKKKRRVVRKKRVIRPTKRKVTRKRAYKINRSKTMAKRKRRRSYKRKSPRRSYKRNPRFSIMDIVVNGAIAGAGAVGTLFVSNLITKLMGKTQNSTMKNVIRLAVAVGAGFLAHRFISDTKKAEAFANGGVAAVALSFADTTFGMGLLAGQDEIDTIVDDMELLGLADEIDYESMNGLADEIDFESMSGENWNDLAGEEDDYLNIS